MYTLQYCEDNLKFIGEGSSRRVFELNDKWIIKKPSTYGGIWQNENELDIYKKLKNTGVHLCHIDLNLSDKNSIIMRKAKSVSSNISMWFDYLSDIHDSLMDDSGNLNEDKLIELNEKVEESGYKSIKKFFNALNNISLTDAHNIMWDAYDTNCGICGNKLVLVDYGYIDDFSSVKLENFSQYTEEYKKYHS